MNVLEMVSAINPIAFEDMKEKETFYEKACIYYRK